MCGHWLHLFQFYCATSAGSFHFVHAEMKKINISMLRWKTLITDIIKMHTEGRSVEALELS